MFDAEAIYNVAYGIWNSLLTVAMTLFTTSPMDANGDVYTITHNLFIAISGVSIPLAELFMLLGMYSDIIGSPKEQQLRRLFMNFFKFGVILIILSKLWSIIGDIMSLADELTALLGMTGTYTLSMPDELRTVISEAAVYPENTTEFTVTTIHLYLGELVTDLLSYVGLNVTLWLTSVVTLGIMAACSISILNSAYQRIIKPLVVIPFATITVAMASGSHEEARTTWNYIKMFFGMCLSGAFMVICIKLGVALSTGGLVTFDVASMTNMVEKILFVTVQNAITPLIITGLVKGADSTIARIF